MKNLFMAMMIFFSSVAFAKEADEMQITNVLKGDTALAVDYQHKAKYVHIAGVDCPEMNQSGGPEARAMLSQLTLNKTIFVTTLVSAGTHSLVKMEPRDGSVRDVGAALLKNGLCWFRNQDSDNLDSIQRSSYKILADQAKYSKKGIWLSGDIYGNIDPDSWRTADLQNYDQPRFNGNSNPELQNFERPNGSGESSVPSSPKQPQLKNHNVGDWRTKIYKDN